MKNNKNDRITLARDTSLPKERFSQITKLKNLNIQKSSKKLSNSQNKSINKSLNNENQLDNNINSNDNDNNKNILDNQNDNDDKNNNINDNNPKKINKKSNPKPKEMQNACTQVNFWKEMMESEIKNTLMQYEEREKEMQLKIKDLLRTIQDIKFNNILHLTNEVFHFFTINFGNNNWVASQVLIFDV